jgi:hypothetical protein
MSGETLDFAPPNVVKPKCRFPIAPTPWRWRRGPEWKDFCCRPRSVRTLALDP